MDYLHDCSPRKCPHSHIEMQVRKPEDSQILAKRARYYQSAIDTEVLKSGEQYKELNPTYIIFLCPFSLFDGKRHIYTFQTICKEDNELLLGDATTKIFLSSKGTDNDVSSDIQAFLRYMEGIPSENDFVQEIDEVVHSIKKLEHERRDYMTLEEKIQEEREEARKEALKEGQIEFAKRLIRKNMDVQFIVECTKMSVAEIESLKKELASD